MPNYENFIAFDYWQYEVIRHAFSLTFAVFAAALVYFGMSAKSVVPRFRNTAYISAVVMVSAFLEIVALWYLWNVNFEFDTVANVFAVPEGKVFSNGYRYANWLIDVPMLLTQFLVVLGFTGAAFYSRWRKLTLAGVAMILTGYVGQYYEPQVAGFIEGNGLPFWIWGGISWLIFFYLLYAANEAFKTGLSNLDPSVRDEMRRAWRILYITWWLYGLAYLIPGIPGINQDPTWVVIRQLAYTFADITSKAVFGIVLARVAMKQSAVEDPRYAPGEPERGLPADKQQLIAADR
ncbi:MAG: bacteriorhodopsin [Pseudomonadota bacterium]